MKNLRSILFMTAFVIMFSGCWGGAFFAVSEITDDKGETTTVAPPTAFTQVTPTDGFTEINALTPTLTWDDSKAETNYVVEIDNSPTFTVPLSYQSFPLIENTSTLQIPPGFLTSGTTYYWRVAARNGGGTTFATNQPLSFVPYEGPWGRTYSFSVFLLLTVAKPTPDGGFIATGFTRSGGDSGSEDISVIRFNSDSTIAWQKSFAGGDVDEGVDLFLTPEGNITVFAWTQSFIGGGGWVLNLDPAGELISSRVINSGNIDDLAFGMDPTSDGGFILGGNSDVAGNRENWVVKFASDYTLEWEFLFGGLGTDIVRSVRQTSDGGYLVVGDSDSFSIGNRDIFVIKLNGAGTIEWQNTYGGPTLETRPSILPTSDGGSLIVGQTDSFGAGSQDAWVIKLNSDGSIAWEFIFEETLGDRFIRAYQAADGGYFLVGALGDDGFVVKLSSAGVVEWQKTYGGASGEELTSMFQRADGTLIMLGTTSSFGPFGSWIFQTDSNGDFPGVSTDTNIVPNPTGISPQPVVWTVSSPATNMVVPNLNPSTTAVVGQIYP